MPRQLALILCSLFVLFLLRLDRKSSNEVSWALWIPTLWMFLITSRSIDTWLGVAGGDRETGGVLDPILQAGLLCMGLIVLARRKLDWSRVIRSNGWLFALIGYMFVSILWSDMPLRSLRSWIKEILAVVAALVVVTEPQPIEAVQSLIRRMVYFLIPFSVLLVKYYPDLGVVYHAHSGEIQWIGVTIQKNSLGHLCLISTFFLVWAFIGRMRAHNPSVLKYQTAAEVLLLIMTFWLLKGPSLWAASATAIYAVSVGLATFFSVLWMSKHRIVLGNNIWVIITACIIGLGTITPLVGGSTVTAFTSAVGRDSTLTGRTEIWTGLLPDLEHQPILGYGFSGFWTSSRIIDHEIGQAHNGYLEMWLQLGLIGVLLMTALLLSSVRNAHKILKDDFDQGCLCLCFVLMVAVESIADSSTDSFNRPIMACVLVLSVLASSAAKRQRVAEYGMIAEPRGLASISRF